MKLKTYDFEAKSWPPPKEKQNKDTYLFGFDSDNQPYILRWEQYKGSEGWCSSTLEDKSDNRKVSAFPMYFGPKDTQRRIVLWAEAPLLKSVAERLTQQKKAS